ncbi:MULTISPECIES: GTA head formation protein, RCAP_rcc01685 family [Falsihalocynthiibacter]|uniref:GTA head formation protein, RCAP_rcc01685 family n=1 Tax=Falsihalocynthiibacter TaxID=2854182 RepID=UPI0030022848
MSEQPHHVGGSRYLYEGFDAAAARIDANERVTKLQFQALDQRLSRIEQALERLERRLWLAVYGVVGVILAQGIISLMEMAPK